MMASRGMGNINPKKMPGGKEITRTDDPNKVKVYKKGGLAKQAATAIAMKEAGKKPKKMAEGDLVDDVSVKPNYVALDKNFKAVGARVEGKKSLGKDAELLAYMDLDAMKAGNQSTKASPSKVGVNYTKRFAEGGELKEVPEENTGLSKLPTEVRNKMGYMKEGGKTKSKVNEAGNYTKPDLRKRIFNSVKAAAIVGTGAGQWSARKAQVMAKRYKAAGGGYRD
jgi:hypothetical protein